MKKAWIENGLIRDIANGNPEDLYHPDIAKHYDTDVPDDAVSGDGWEDGILIKPEPPEPQPAVPQPEPDILVSPIEFKLLFKLHERVAIKAARATDPIVDDFLEIVEDVRLTHVNLSLSSTKEGVNYLESEGLIGEGRAALILSNTQPQ